MDWDIFIRAVDGDPAALNRLKIARWSHDVAVGAALLLLEETPHPAAALVVAGVTARERHDRPDVAALTPHAASALAEWRADPDWTKRCIGSKYPDSLFDGVAALIAALHDAPPALHDAVSIVARAGGPYDIYRCLTSLGADGWGLLDDKERGALWTRALQDAPVALGSVWTALSAAQQAATAQRASAEKRTAAVLIGHIGAAAWTTTDAALRDLLIDVAAQAPWLLHHCAPAWGGMSDKERERLVTAVVAQGLGGDHSDLLEALGRDGRRALSAAQRGALDARAAQISAKMTALLRVVDAGWNDADDDDRRTLLDGALPPWCAVDLTRAVGSDGWRELPTDVRHACRAAVQRKTDALFRCPPALWVDLVGDRHLPPATAAAWRYGDWRAEDADADLSALPHEHQALVLTRAPWLAADCVPLSLRMARLLDVWNDMTADARIDLATAQPWTLAVVAAAARLAARESAIAATSRRTTASIADTLAVMMLRDGPECGTRGVIGTLLAAGARWRPEMRAFAPTGGDPPEVWKPWLAAALLGAIPDRGIVLPLMARGAPRPTRWLRRGGRGG